MLIQFFTNFSKRENSTKRPSGTVDLSLTGYLREPCSVENPVFKIERLNADICPETYVYAIIPMLGRFYFVTDWVWAEGLWECHLREDYLATWKTYIGASTAYVERSASSYNGAITDKLYPVTTDFSTTGVSLASGYYNIAPTGGCFVLGIINNANFATSQAGGAVTYYAMTIPQMRSLMNYLLGTGFLDDAGFPATATPGQQLLQDTAKAFVNPVQYIASCIWYPVTVDMIAEQTPSSIVLGYWDLDSNVAQGHKVNSFVFTQSITGNIPAHPQAATRGKYLNYSPYTRLTLQAPPFGSIPIDTSFCEIGSYLWARVYVDIITGKAQIRVRIQPDAQHETSTAIVTEASAMFGVPIQIAQMTPDYLNAISSVVSFASNVATGMVSGNYGQGDLNALLSLNSIGNAIDSLMPQARTEGVSGSFVQYVLPPVLTAQHFVVTDEDNTELGRPLCEVKRIDTLSGFIKCGEATVDYPCFLSEKKEVYNYLRQGFFYE